MPRYIHAINVSEGRHKIGRQALKEFLRHKLKKGFLFAWSNVFSERS
jgi:hypothetical protein